METVEFNLEGSYIELIQLLKALGVAQTGGHAKMIVDGGEIVRSGEVEQRKRAKIRKGETIEIGKQIRVIVK